MKLFDVQPFKYKVVENRKRPGVLMSVEGTFQRADVKNANKRIYPRNVWDKVLADSDVRERLQSRRMLGELDHPQSGATSLSRVSHVVTEQEMLPTGEIRGRIDVLDTPAGKIASTLFEAGVQLGVSSRGDGSITTESGDSVVQDDFQLETYDLVLKPSTPGAFPRICESVEEEGKNNNLIAESLSELVKDTSDMNVLLECHKIISALDCDLTAKDTALNNLKTKIIESKKNGTVTEQTGDETMANQNSPQPISEDRNTVAYIQEQVSKGISEAVAKKDEELNQLNRTIVRLTNENELANKKINAAEQIIDELRFRLNSSTSKVKEDKNLARRYTAAKQLLDEAIKRLQELGDTKRRLGAAKQLLGASIDRHKQESVNKSIDSILRNVNESVAKKLRPILESCKTSAEVYEKYKSVYSLIESVSPRARREPLPNRTQEAKKNVQGAREQIKEHTNFTVNQLLQRLNG